MEIEVILRDREPVTLERIHVYSTMSAHDFLSFYQRDDDFDADNPLATRGYHFLRTEVLSFTSHSDEIDVAWATKRRAEEQQADEEQAWALRAHNLQTDENSPN